jgi:hypothetical protein
MRYLGILGCYMAQRESGSLPTSRLEDRFPGWCPLKISLGLVAVMDRLSNVLPRLLWWQWIALGCGLTHHFQGEWIAPWPARLPICLSGRGAMDCTGWGLTHHSLKDMDCTRLETYPSASEGSGLHLPEGQTPVTEHPPTFSFACLLASICPYTWNTVYRRRYDMFSGSTLHVNQPVCLFAWPGAVFLLAGAIQASLTIMSCCIHAYPHHVLVMYVQ